MSTIASKVGRSPLTPTCTRLSRATILLVTWSWVGRPWALCTSTTTRRHLTPCELWHEPGQIRPVWHDIMSQIQSDWISLHFGAGPCGYTYRFRGWVAARYQLGIIVTGLIKDWQTCRLELSPRRTLLTPDMVESTFSFLMDRRECTWNLNAMPAKRQSLWWGSGCNAAIQIPKCGNSRTWVELIYELMAIGWEVPNSSKFDLQFSPSIHHPRRNPSKSTSATATKP